MALCPRAFRKPKMSGEEQINKKFSPKVNMCSEKVAFEKIFWSCRMVGKRKHSTRALRLHN